MSSTRLSTPKSVKVHDAVVAEPADPDRAVLRLHFEGDVVEPVDVFAKFLGDTVYGSDMGDLVDVHAQAVRAEMARA
jgi:hypothetical protein